MSGCFSNFKQLYARGQQFAYSLEDIARYYLDYVDLMAHFDAVLPGRIHRVVYERMVDDTEDEVRRLLEYCGLPFEDACLRFYETERAVRTRVRNRCASRSFARASNSGRTTNCGSRRSRTRSARHSTRIRKRRRADAATHSARRVAELLDPRSQHRQHGLELRAVRLPLPRPVEQPAPHL